MVLNPVGTKQGFLNLSSLNGGLGKKQSSEQGKCRYKRSGGMMHRPSHLLHLDSPC